MLWLGWPLIVAGFLVALPGLCEKLGFLTPIKQFINAIPGWHMIQMLIGIACVAGGLYRIYLPEGGMQYTGDLAPALFAVFAGFILGHTFFKNLKFLPFEKLTHYALPIGVIAMGLGIVHQFFWTTLGYGPYL